MKRNKLKEICPETMHMAEATPGTPSRPVQIVVAIISLIGVIAAAYLNSRSSAPSAPNPDQPVEAAIVIIDTLETPAMLYSEDLKVVYANEKMAAIYKMQKSDMVGKSPDMLNMIIKPYVKNYKDFAAEQLDRIARGHRGETEGQAKVPMRLTAEYMNLKRASDWFFVSNPVYLAKKRFTLTQLLEQVNISNSRHLCAPEN